ncbi:Ger(x)C family spore germination protein [Brevibacillus fluminis]|uniref:Ger(x)C family spore germination protein n=1 Tax=Brevibacillus fluminis TaxID=511487 RepID=UPI003F8B98D1
MKRRRRSLLCALLIPALLLSGCWDRREIEDIGMAVGMAIDKGPKANMLHLTTQFVNTVAGNNKDVTQVHSYYNVDATGTAMLVMIRQMASKTDRTPYFTHLKVVLISDEIARQYNMFELTNLLMRDHEIRRTVQMLVVKGKASDLLGAHTRKQEIPSLEIWGMTGNDYKSMYIPHVVTLGDISIHLSDHNSFVIQYIRMEKGGFRLSGVAVISGKTKKLIGTIENLEQMSGLSLLLLKGMGSSGGAIRITDPKTKKPLVFDVRNVNRRVSVNQSNGKIVFTAQIRLEGRLNEDWTYPGNAFKESYLRERTKQFEQKVLQDTKAALAVLQKQLKVDVLGYEDKFRIADYASWKKWKNNWDDVFSKSEIIVDVKVFIRDYGSAGRKV